jgi:hypothetical protein
LLLYFLGFMPGGSLGDGLGGLPLGAPAPGIMLGAPAPGIMGVEGAPPIGGILGETFPLGNFGAALGIDLGNGMFVSLCIYLNLKDQRE